MGNEELGGKAVGVLKEGVCEICCGVLWFAGDEAGVRMWWTDACGWVGLWVGG